MVHDTRGALQVQLRHGGRVGAWPEAGRKVRRLRRRRVPLEAHLQVCLVVVAVVAALACVEVLRQITVIT